MKRGSEQTTWIVVSLLLALIVFVVIIAIFTRQTTGALEQTTCAKQGLGYKCVARAASSVECVGPPAPFACGPEQVCCKVP